MDNNVVNNELNLSEWLTENLELEKIVGVLTNTETAVQEEQIPEFADLSLNEKKLSAYSFYSQSYTDSAYTEYVFYVYGQYSKYSFTVYGQYGFSNYSFSVYGFSVYSFSNYGFSVYSFTVYGQYGFSNYSFSVYGQYSAYGFYVYGFSVYNRYDDYYFASCATCQVCNVCQGKCESAQKVSDYTGKISIPTTAGSSIDDADWNKVVTMIKTGAPYNNKTAPSLNNAVAGQTIKAVDNFNPVKNAIAATFENANTGLSDKSAGSSALMSDLVTMANKLNNDAKISASILCCQTKGGQGCLHCQDRCQGCQSQKDSCKNTCQATQA